MSEPTTAQKLRNVASAAFLYFKDRREADSVSELLRDTADYIEALEEDVEGNNDTCATKLHEKNKRLRAENAKIYPLWGASEDKNWELSKALRQIAANTCCGSCQEAALVAKEALAAVDKGES